MIIAAMTDAQLTPVSLIIHWFKHDGRYMKSVSIGWRYML